MRTLALVAVAVAAAVVVPLVLAGAEPGKQERRGGADGAPPPEAGRSYFFAYEFSGDIRRLHVDSPGSVEGEYLGEQRELGQGPPDPGGEPNEKPTVFWVNLDRVAVVKAWPRHGE